MFAQHRAQGLVEQVRTSVVGFAGSAQIGVYAGHEVGFGVLRQSLGDMYREVIFPFSVYDFYGLVFRTKHTAVAHLSAHFGIERRVVEYDLIERLFLLRYFAVAEDVAFVLSIVPAFELGFSFLYYHPVARFHGCGVACAFFLLLHLRMERFFVHGHAVFTTDEFRQVERETIGVEQREGFHAVYDGLLGGTCLGHHAVEQADTGFQGAQEGVFFLFHHFGDEHLLGFQLWVGFSHFLYEYGQELVHESFFLA